MSRSGRFAATRLNHDPDSEQTDAVTFDRSGTVQCEVPLSVPHGYDYNAGITAINDAGDFILYDSRENNEPFYYRNNVSVGKLLDLSPQTYRQQVQKTDSPYDIANFRYLDRLPPCLTNAGQLLFPGRNLEGPGQGQWVERYFRSDPIPGSSTMSGTSVSRSFPATG